MNFGRSGKKLLRVEVRDEDENMGVTALVRSCLGGDGYIYRHVVLEYRRSDPCRPQQTILVMNERSLW
jgi:hypothetical protein